MVKCSKLKNRAVKSKKTKLVKCSTIKKIVKTRKM